MLLKTLQISIWNKLPQNLSPELIAKLVSDGRLKPETLGRRKRVRASFQDGQRKMVRAKLPKDN